MLFSGNQWSFWGTFQSTMQHMFNVFLCDMRLCSFLCLHACYIAGKRDWQLQCNADYGGQKVEPVSMSVASLGGAGCVENCCSKKLALKMN